MSDYAVTVGLSISPEDQARYQRELEAIRTKQRADGTIQVIGGIDYSTGPGFLRALDNGSPLICSCGSRSFGLHYGSYEIVATCTACGHAETVYDG